MCFCLQILHLHVGVILGNRKGPKNYLPSPCIRFTSIKRVKFKIESSIYFELVHG